MVIRFPYRIERYFRLNASFLERKTYPSTDGKRCNYFERKLRKNRKFSQKQLF